MALRALFSGLGRLGASAVSGGIWRAMQPAGGRLPGVGAALAVTAPASLAGVRWASGRGVQVRRQHRDNALPYAASRAPSRSAKRATKRTFNQSQEFAYATDRIFHPVVLSVALSPQSLAYCSMDAGGIVLEWGIRELPLPEGDPATFTPSIEQLHDLVHGPLFQAADRVVIENQAGGRMRQLEAYLHAFLFERAHLVRPQAARAHFGLKVGTQKMRNTMAVTRCMELTEVERERLFLGRARQKEALANVYLLARYAHAAGLHRRQHALKDELPTETDALTERTKPRVSERDLFLHHPSVTRTRVEVVAVK